MKLLALSISFFLLIHSLFGVASVPGNDSFVNTSGSTFGTAFDADTWISYSSNSTPGYIASGNYVEFYGQGVHSATWNAFPSYNQDFSVSLGVANYHTSTTGGFADLGLRIYDSDGTYLDHISNIIGSYTFSGAASRDIMSYSSGVYTNTLQFAQAATLSVDYSAATKTFALGYSYNDGVDTTIFRTINIDGGLSNAFASESVSWGMSDSSVFEIAMFMASDATAPAAGSLLTTVDNFSVVPEPSTYALILGLVGFISLIAKRRLER